MSLRVAIVADYLEEGWPSMDLVADMLLDQLRRRHAATIDATLVRPRMPQRLSRALAGRMGSSIVDRIAARQLHYPRVLAALPQTFDVYHVVDHSYGHLALGLPGERTMVTCHDVDAFRSILQPDDERRGWPYRRMTRRILDGVRRASRVACDSAATRDALETLGAIPAERLTVIPNGTDTGGRADADLEADREAALMLGPRGHLEVLHVGSTIPRKRIDVLLDAFAAVRASRPEARLIRVGGPFTAAQRIRARELGVLDAIAVLPFVDRVTLAAVYHRATVAMLPSEREGFGLPVVEALACGTPVVASDIPALREVGGDAVTFAPVGDISAWRDAVLGLADERDRDPAAWRARKAAGLARAAEFSWSRYADEVAAMYATVATAAPPAPAARAMRPGASVPQASPAQSAP
ncbi:MAG TPA: glycosyltransferase family 1 protein [Vicinamibacterales bacterium]